MKLELRHLAAYLPYKVQVKKSYWSIRFSEQIEEVLILVADDIVWYINDSDIKLILRPLSDLTKPEFANELNEKFFHGSIPINNEYTPHHFLYDLNNGVKTIPLWQAVKIYEWLLSKHFDVYNLIESKIAIDINTINN